MPFTFLYQTTSCAAPLADLRGLCGGQIDSVVGGFDKEVKDQTFVCTVQDCRLTIVKQVISVCSKVVAVCVLMFLITQG